MRRVFLVARREWQENIRQRWLLASLGLQLGAILSVTVLVLGGLESVSHYRNIEEKIAYFTDVMGMPTTLDGLVFTVVQGLDYLALTQLLGMTAVLAGHTGLHDRQCGTLPFLLLAPMRRFEMLAGKVLGALSVPLAFNFALAGAAMGYAALMPVTAPAAELLPPQPAFLVAFFLGAPAWAAAIGALCVAISALAHDVRTAQQASWMLVFFATFIVGPALVTLMPWGAVVQGVVAAVGAACAIIATQLATVVASRELGR
jgi:ABC-type Na+ efflux pump permease subunit